MFPDGSCYLLGTSLEVEQADDLTIDGFGSVIRSAVTRPDCHGGPPVGPDAHVWVISDSNHVRLRGFRLVGTNPRPGVYNGAYYCQHGVEILSSDDVTLDGLTVQDMWGDCAYWNSNLNDAPRPVGGLVTNMTCSGSGREGVSIVNGSNVTISRSSFADLRNGVTTDRNTINDEAPNLSVTDNTFSGVQAAMVNLAGGGADDAVVTGNTCDASRPCLINVHGDATDPIEGVSITDSVSSADAISSGWQVANVHELVIERNTYACPLSSSGRPFREFLRFSGAADDVRVVDNRLPNCIDAKDAAGSTQTDVAMEGNSTSP